MNDLSHEPCLKTDTLVSKSKNSNAIDVEFENVRPEAQRIQDLIPFDPTAGHARVPQPYQTMIQFDKYRMHFPSTSKYVILRLLPGDLKQNCRTKYIQGNSNQKYYCNQYYSIFDPS